MTFRNWLTRYFGPKTTVAQPEGDRPIDVESAIGKYGLTHKRQEILSLVEYSTHLRTQQSNIVPRGDSKIGGHPDLPKNFMWPQKNGHPLSFLCQIELSSIRAFAAGKFLPSNGRLYFFYDVDNQPWGFDPKDKGSWQVIFSDEPVGALSAITPPASTTVFDQCSVSPFDLPSLPDVETIDLQDVGLTEAEEDQLFETAMELTDFFPSHKLFGHPNVIQGDIFDECQLASNGVNVGDPEGYQSPQGEALLSNNEKWVLLLQMDSDDNANMEWGDLGRLYFAIRERDLLSEDFSGSWLVLQCS